MEPIPAFVAQFVWFLAVWTTIALVVVEPRLRSRDPDEILMTWLVPQLFRVLGVGLLVQNLAPDLPFDFALQTAVGDTVTAVLALAAIVALHRRSAAGPALAWACTLVGSGDLVLALTHAARIGAARHLTAQWYVPALVVPLAIVSHAMALSLLLRRRGT